VKLRDFTVLKEHESPVGPEAGLDPLPVPTGPLDPFHAAWTVAAAWPVAFGLMGAALAGSVPVTLVVPFERFQTRWPQLLLGQALRITRGARRRTYDPGFDPRRVSLFMMNHTSMLDAHVACWAIPQPFCGINHEHHFRLPIYGWLLRRGNGIGVAKGARGQAAAIGAQVADRVRRGISILGFPEGRRTQNGRVLPFRRGMFLVARDAGVPVVPLCVRGLWGVLRRGEWIIRPGPLDVLVGPQVETAGLSDDEVSALCGRFQQFTADFVERGVVGDVAALHSSGSPQRVPLGFRDLRDRGNPSTRPVSEGS
jgi:1-acyl-sn-glycerol-3-phosphate acyltransferase